MSVWVYYWMCTINNVVVVVNVCNTCIHNLSINNQSINQSIPTLLLLRSFFFFFQTPLSWIQSIAFCHLGGDQASHFYTRYSRQLAYILRTKHLNHEFIQSPFFVKSDSLSCMQARMDNLAIRMTFCTPAGQFKIEHTDQRTKQDFSTLSRF